MNAGKRCALSEMMTWQEKKNKDLGKIEGLKRGMFLEETCVLHRQEAKTEVKNVIFE